MQLATIEIPGYDRFERMASDGVATVYRARKTSLDKPVVVKVLSPRIVADRGFLDQFRRDERLAARVQHESIAALLDCGVADGQHFVVWESCEGPTVADFLESQPRLPVDVAFAVLHRVCRALEAAHAVGLTHRGIRPGSILITDAGSVKVTDFGLAPPTTWVARRGDAVSPNAPYLAPEQASGRAPCPATDIFALGAVAYHMLTGQSPFAGSDDDAVLRAIQGYQPPAVSRLNPLVERSLERIVQRMLEKELGDRYEDASEIIADVEEAMEECRLGFGADTLSQYVDGPDEYLERFCNEMLERTAGHPPPGIMGGRGRHAQIRYYHKVLFLDPNDEGARKALDRLGEVDSTPTAEPPGLAPEPVEAIGDGTAEYNVYLDEIDPSVESLETFAMKLSIRTKMLLPRVNLLMRNLPGLVAGNLPIETARKLDNVLTGLGGTTRIEVCPPRPTRESQAGVSGSDGGQAAKAPDICPSCRWALPKGAKFCTMCGRPFGSGANAATAQGSREGDVVELGGPGPARFIGPLPLNVAVYLGVGIVVLILLIVLGR